MRENFGGVLVHNSVIEELALIASAWQFWLIASVAIPRGCSIGRCWQTGRTRDQTVVLLLVAGWQLLGQECSNTAFSCGIIQKKMSIKGAEQLAENNITYVAAREVVTKKT